MTSLDFVGKLHTSPIETNNDIKFLSTLIFKSDYTFLKIALNDSGSIDWLDIMILKT